MGAVSLRVSKNTNSIPPRAERVGWTGWPAEAPFDAILVTAAPEIWPPPLLEQLKLGGRLVTSVGSRRERQDLLFVERRSDGETSTHLVTPAACVPLVRRAEE